MLGICGGVLAVVGYTVTVVLWINAIGNNAKADNIDNARKIDSINVKLDANDRQRELTLKNRDLQIDSLKSDVERVNKRQDATDAVLTDFAKKLERVLVISEGIDKRLNAKP